MPHTRPDHFEDRDVTQDLLRKIRAVMEREARVQKRLDQFVKLIVENMQVQVASIYLQRGANELELCATKGLKRGAVHKTRLGSGEGLVGHVAASARPLNLADAASHPMFAYRPETGEDKLQSFLGVPILRGGRTLGVLVAQSETQRTFREYEVEGLQTVAMILAEIAIEDERAAGKRGRLKGIRLNPIKPETLSGIGFSKGLSRGYAHLHMPPTVAGKLIADDVSHEEERVEEAIAYLRRSVDAMISGETAKLSHASKEIFESYRLFAYDRKWVSRLREAVHSGLTAEAAVERVRNEYRARLSKARDPYLRARLHDLEDLANRMLRSLAGDNLAPGNKDMAADAIVFARDLGPAELLDYDRDKLRGIVLEEGSASSHTAIICKALGIPMVGRVSGVLDIVEMGNEALVDGNNGQLDLRPLESRSESFDLRINIQNELNKAFEKLKDVPAITKDDVRVDLNLNVGLLVDLPQLDTVGADGIGLFRTEFQFMIGEVMPKLSEQTDLYRKAIEVAGDRPVIFRTLDLGGDKILPYSEPVPEENPALGWRSIRIALDRPGLMRYQLRALIAAAAGYNLSVMFPMVATVDEFLRAKEQFNKELQRASQMQQVLPLKTRIGVMLETPALAWQVDAIAAHADFVSVGANDLMQFMFAADRDNMRVSERYDILHPAALSVLNHIAKRCAAHGVPVSVCGEAAGRPLEACCLVALGYSSLSMSVTGIGPVKSALLTLKAKELREFILPLITSASDESSIREHLRLFCMDKGIAI